MALQLAMKGNRGILQPKRRRLKSPRPFITGRIPVRWGMRKNIAPKSICLRKRILNVETPQLPWPNGTEGHHMEMRGAKTHASGGLH